MIINAGKSVVTGKYQLSQEIGDEQGVPIPGTYKALTPWFNNLITNKGLDNLAAAHAMRYASVGAGSTTPAFSDTALANRVSTSQGGGYVAGSSGSGYVSAIVTCVFPQGAAAGNLSEIGMGPNADGTNLSSRALILDGAGNPTTITVEDIAILTVTYELRVYYDLSDRLATITVGGVPRNTVTRVGNMGGSSVIQLLRAGFATDSSASVTHTSGDIGPAGVRFTPGAVGGTSVFSAYAPGTRVADFSASYSVSQGNGTIAGVQSAYTPETSPLPLKTSFDPPIIKDNTKTLTVNWRRSWGRV